MIAPPQNRYCKKLSDVKKRSSSGALTKTVVCIVAIVLALFVALVFMRGGDDKVGSATGKQVPRKESRPRNVSEVKANHPTPPKAEPVPEEPKIEVKRYGRSSNVPTSNTNNIHYASQTGLKVVDADGNVRDVRAKPVFRSRTDNMLWAAVRPGGMPSGLNALRSRMRFQTGSDEAFLQSLRNQDITIEPDDPPHVVNAKKMTKEIKEGIIAELDNGHSFDDIYKEICAETKKERIYERIAQEDMRKIAKVRDAEAMRKYVEDMNPVIRKLGLKELRLPSWAEIDEVDIENTDN